MARVTSADELLRTENLNDFFKVAKEVVKEGNAGEANSTVKRPRDRGDDQVPKKKKLPQRPSWSVFTEDGLVTEERAEVKAESDAIEEDTDARLEQENDTSIINDLNNDVLVYEFKDSTIMKKRKKQKVIRYHLVSENADKEGHYRH